MKRPGVQEFLERMSKLYEIVIFTASLSLYADPLMDVIDPSHHATYRLFRDHCTAYNNLFVKDLSALGRDLKRLMIVDNSPTAYSFQPENAIPSITWIDDMEDKQLLELATALELMVHVEDVREVIKKNVKDNTMDYVKLAEYLRNIINMKEKQMNENCKVMKKAMSLDGREEFGYIDEENDTPNSDSKETPYGFARTPEPELGEKILSKIESEHSQKKSLPDSTEDNVTLKKKAEFGCNKKKKKCGTPTPYTGKIIGKQNQTGKYSLKGQKRSNQY